MQVRTLEIAGVGSVESKSHGKLKQTGMVVSLSSLMGDEL